MKESKVINVAILSLQKKLFRKTGLVSVFSKSSDAIPTMIKNFKDQGIAYEEMTSRDVTKKLPGLFISDDMKGVYETEAGFLKADTCLKILQVTMFSQRFIISFILLNFSKKLLKWGVVSSTIVLWNQLLPSPRRM